MNSSIDSTKFESLSLPSVEKLLSNFSQDLQNQNKSYEVVKLGRIESDEINQNQNAYLALIKAVLNENKEYIILEFSGEKGKQFIKRVLDLTIRKFPS
jgi:hypothetical protein